MSVKSEGQEEYLIWFLESLMLKAAYFIPVYIKGKDVGRVGKPEYESSLDLH